MSNDGAPLGARPVFEDDRRPRSVRAACRAPATAVLLPLIALHLAVGCRPQSSRGPAGFTLPDGVVLDESGEPIVSVPAHAKQGNGGPEADPAAREEALEDFARRQILSGEPAARVRGDIRDAATGGALPSRILLRDGGRMEPGALLPSVGFWCDGRFRLRALPGVGRVQVSAGRRRSVAEQDVRLMPGRRAKVRVDLHRPEVLRFEDRGWIGADLLRPVGGRSRLRAEATLQLLALAARGEGLAFCGAAESWLARGSMSWPDAERRMRDECEALSGDGLTLVPATRGSDCPLYGSMFVLGGSGSPGGRHGFWDAGQPNFLTMIDARARGSISILHGIADARELDPRADIVAVRPDLEDIYRDAPVALGNVASELPFDAVAGILPDAIALSGSQAETDVWFRLLAMGYRLPAVHVERGSFAAGVIPAERTFVRIGVGNEPTVENVVAAVRDGKVMASNGGFVFLTVAGEGPGAVFKADGVPRGVRIEAYSSTLKDDAIHSVEFIRNGDVMETIPGLGRTMIAATLAIREAETAWYIARARSGPKGERVAWTAPIYFEGQQRAEPKPMSTRVRGRVVDEATGEPLAASISAYLGGELVAEVASDRTSGAYEITCSPAARLRARAAGHAPGSVRVFFHTGAPALIRSIHIDEWGKGASVLAEEATYERMRLAAGEAEIDFGLQALP